MDRPAIRDLDDNALIACIRNGDSRALETLLERHYDTMFRIAYRWCRSADDAEDVAQEACVDLARGILRFRGEAAFTTWLYRLVLNAARDWQRRETRIRRREERGEDAMTENVHDPSPDQEQQVFTRQLLDRIDDLPAKEKDAVFLVFGEDLSHREAAKVLECAETTISWRIHRARKRLARSLKQTGDPDCG